MKQVVIRGATEIPRACEWVSQWLAKGLEAGKPIIIKLAYESRTQAQNRLMWPLLDCFAKQHEYSGRMWNDKAWKMILLSGYLNDPSGIIIGLHGEVINTNLHSSDLSKAKFSEFIESIYAQGCEWGIEWSEPAIKSYNEVTNNGA